MKKLTLLAILLCSCDSETDSATEHKQRAEPTTISETTYDCGWLNTVKHDGHLFVVEGRPQKGGILHHPDCPCQKK